MSRLLLSSSCLALLLAAAACGGASTTTAASTGPASVADERCPMAIPGTSVTAEDTATGGALVFASTGDLAGLRARVGGWATRHNERHGAMGPLPTGDEPAGAGHDHAHHDHGQPAVAAHPDHGGADGHGAHHEPGAATGALVAIDPAAMIAAHSRAEASETDAGARLQFFTFPDQVPALQAELRAHVEHLTVHGCTGAP